MAQSGRISKSKMDDTTIQSKVKRIKRNLKNIPGPIKMLDKETELILQ